MKTRTIWSDISRTLRQSYTIALFAAVIAVVGVVSPVGMKWLENRQRKTLYLTVTNELGAPIYGASVALGRGSTQPTTDKLGVVRIDTKLQSRIDAHIVADGYSPGDISVSLPRTNPNVTVVLTPVPSEPTDAREPYFEIVRSGPLQSGLGANFSQWYELKSPPPLPGFELDLENTQYFLSGDRRCNEWSECELKRLSDQQVVFMFRMQGHSEWFPPRPALSEGILRVQYKPAAR